MQNTSRYTGLMLLLFISATALCQTGQTRYYKDRYFQKETTEARGRFSRTNIQNADGSITTEVKDINRDETISTETHKGDEPTGIWRYKGRNITEPLDYSFTLVYAEASCTDTIAGLKNYFENNDTLKYIAPKLKYSGKGLNNFLAGNIYYPDDARDNNIQGKVYLSFTITADGKMGDVVVVKGTHVILDKEAVRVLRKLEFSSPPIVDGHPRPVCVRTPISFVLE